MNLATSDKELFKEGFDEIDEESILELAEQLSLSPKFVIGMEEGEGIITDIIINQEK